jgi:2-dehydro-3-deoxyphosphooctonate aldolase (KDO 8-P synthase)
MIKLNQIKIGNGNPFVLIAGPCVVEGKEITNETAEKIKEVADELNIPFIFKASYRKANRTSVNSFSGIGDEKALQILNDIKSRLSVPILTDIHKPEEVKITSEVADILQIPAFLSRQTELLQAAGESGRIVNIKKGQFLAPEDMKHAAEKVKSKGNENILLTERGTTFGYHNLIVDMRSLVIMKELGYPVVMDATHSVQMPSTGNATGGEPKYIPALAKAAAAVGIDALFLEVHPKPEKALSDAASQLSLDKLNDLLTIVKKIDATTKEYDRSKIK